MKNKKFIIITCLVIAILIGIITTLLLITNKNSVDLNKISSFKYHSGSNSSFVQVVGTKSNDLFNINYEQLNGGNKEDDSFTITFNEFKELLNKSKIENCKKHTYEYQCGDRDDCSSASFTVNFENKKNTVCYEINNEIITYFNNFTNANIDENISTVDWTDLEISLNGKQYKYPFKVSDFINNGWTAESSEYADILNNNISYSLSKGYNFVVIKQNELSLTMYFDTTTDKNVLDADVVRFEVTNTNNDNFDFYGLKFGDNEKQIENLFGTKNYEVLEDDTYYTYRYFKKLENNSTATLELQINIEKNKLDKFIISLY